MNWIAIAVTFKLALLTAAVLLIVGLPIAYWLTFSKWRWKFIVESVVALPLVLPPTVLGFYILVAIGPHSPVGRFYSDLVGQVGSQAQATFSNLESQRIISEQLNTRRENVRGVSVNEEAANLILFQRAYQAAARIVTIVDEMFQSVLAIG